MTLLPAASQLLTDWHSYLICRARDHETGLSWERVGPPVSKLILTSHGRQSTLELQGPPPCNGARHAEGYKKRNSLPPGLCTNNLSRSSSSTTRSPLHQRCDQDRKVASQLAFSNITSLNTAIKFNLKPQWRPLRARPRRQATLDTALRSIMAQTTIPSTSMILPTRSPLRLLLSISSPPSARCHP